MTCLINLERQLLRSYSHTQEKKSPYYSICYSQRCNRNHVLSLKVMHKGKYRHMHLFSLHTQLQLCNITEGKEQALSQLDCRAKAFFFCTEVYSGRCQYLPKALLVSGEDFKLVAFEYLSWDKGGPKDRQAKWPQTAMAATRPTESKHVRGNICLSENWCYSNMPLAGRKEGKGLQI